MGKYCLFVLKTSTMYALSQVLKICLYIRFRQLKKRTCVCARLLPNKSPVFKQAIKPFLLGGNGQIYEPIVHALECRTFIDKCVWIGHSRKKSCRVNDKIFNGRSPRANLFF
jgi:hypothetical protein